MTDHDLIARIDSARTLLAEAAHDYGQAALASSMGAEDMVLLDLIKRDRLPITVFTIDTGRLPEQTLDLITRADARYRIGIEVVTPDAEAVAQFDGNNSSDGIFQSVETRKACCALRKVEPLKRALAGKGSWITGLRRTQSAARADIPEKKWDADHGLYKFNPLAAWQSKDIWSYIREREVPCNALHKEGYASIGCAPCTRALKPGEDERAGRWWWETSSARECGLHITQDNTAR
jgi:phosphoadenosine phosphosulfate reductase